MYFLLSLTLFMRIYIYKIYTQLHMHTACKYMHMIIYMHNRDFTSSRAVTQGHPRARGAFHSPIFVKFSINGQ